MPGLEIHPVASRSTLLLVFVLGLWSAGCSAGSSAPRPPHPSLIPALESRVEDGGDQAELLTRLGAAYREAGRLDDARRTLERAHGAAPSSPATTYFLGITYEDLDEWTRAGELYASFLSGSGSGEVREAIENRLPWVRRQEMAEWARRTARRESELADREPGANTVAVFPFVYEGDDPDLSPLAAALSGLLITDLAQVDRLTVLERLRVDFLLDELELGESQRVDPRTAARSGRLLGAAHAVQGRVSGGEDALDVESAVVDVRASAQAVDEPLRAQGPAAALIDAEKELALDIFEALGVQLSAAERERVTERQTENVQALLAYGLGLEAEARGDLDEAATQYSRAVEFDPDFTVADERQDEVIRTSRAAETSIERLAEIGAEGYFESPILSDWRIRRLAFSELELIVPDVTVRDPVSEAFGVEGLGPRSTVLELVFQLPR